MNTYYGLFEDDLTFTTYKEFRSKIKYIIQSYKQMTTKEIVIYRMYVFSRPCIGEKRKEEIWDTITGYAIDFF